MPCAIAAVAFFFPRLVMVLMVILGDYLGQAYQTTLWPLLGFFVAPYTTLAYAWAWHSGGGTVAGFGVFVVIVAVLLDLGAYGGGTVSGKSAMKRRR